MQTAYYAATISEFKEEPIDSIFGKLARWHRHDLEEEQKRAWREQIASLKSELIRQISGQIYFEFQIPRMGKRADVVLLIDGTIFVLEYKVGAKGFDRAAIEQVHDYALDLKNFHRGSHEAPVVPILIGTEAASTCFEIEFADDHVATPICIGKDCLSDVIKSCIAKHQTKHCSLDIKTWDQSGYLPTPTIIEAAQALYQDHDVKEITRSDAGAKNLSATSSRISRIIDDSKTHSKKSICFITGVPGAGKTLAGLNIATSRAKQHSKEHAVFLSGNGPPVEVLREALARDQVAREGIRKTDAQRKVASFIQNIHHFRDEYLRDPNPPAEKVVVFDEAQRAWTKQQASKFMQRKRDVKGFDQSEPDFLIEVMNRHTDWCTIICLIGGGQEINTGEAGLGEWLTALQDKYHDWEVHTSSLSEDPHYTISEDARNRLQAPSVRPHSDLHLSVSIRSFRAEALSSFVGALLSGDAGAARLLYERIKDNYPIWLTRDLAEARFWLRQVARGSERFGLVASSGANRLRPEGIHIKSAIDPSTWFLNDTSDVRSAYYLEEVATEFDVQGLELDWAGVCWDANLRYEQNNWSYHDFRGSKWQSIRSIERKSYLLNAYRVLLTRARQGMVVFVPNGDQHDPTRPGRFYDGTYSFLRSCGIEALPSVKIAT